MPCKSLACRCADVARFAPPRPAQATVRWRRGPPPRQAAPAGLLDAAFCAAASAVAADAAHESVGCFAVRLWAGGWTVVVVDDQLPFEGERPLGGAQAAALKALAKHCGSYAAALALSAKAVLEALGGGIVRAVDFARFALFAELWSYLRARQARGCAFVASGFGGVFRAEPVDGLRVRLHGFGEVGIAELARGCTLLEAIAVTAYWHEAACAGSQLAVVAPSGAERAAVGGAAAFYRGGPPWTLLAEGVAEVRLEPGVRYLAVGGPRLRVVADGPLQQVRCAAAPPAGAARPAGAREEERAAEAVAFVAKRVRLQTPAGLFTWLFGCMAD